MRTLVIVDRWLCPLLGSIALLLVASCQPHPVAVAKVASAVPSTAPMVRREEPQPVLAYCVPHVPSTERISFTLDYDGSDGSREPRFRDWEPPPDVTEDARPETVTFSIGAHEMCQSVEKPTGRRYVLRVPVNAEPSRLDSYVRYAARHGYDQPIFKLNKVIVAAQIENTEYTYNPITSHDAVAEIGTTTIEANDSGQYELRARRTDGAELSAPIGLVTITPYPNLSDCDSKTAEAVRQICAQDTDPCERITLVGVNDIGPLLSVLAFVQSVAEIPLPLVAFDQRHEGASEGAYVDGSFRRSHRVKRFFAALKPETALEKMTPAASLANGKLGLHSPVPSSLVAATALIPEAKKQLLKREWTELGKQRTCEYPGRSAASLVVDKNDKVRIYSERVAVTEHAELLLRAYYDEAQRLRLVVNSETTDTGEAWDAYLVLGEDGCPQREQIATRSELSTNMLHWELKQLVDPRAAYGEPLCIGPLP